MPGSSTTPGRLGARVHAPIRVAFRIRNGVGTRDNNLCEAQWLACAFPYRRFAAVLTDDRARLGADVVSYSFTVSDLHRLLVAGLPAHCERLWTLPCPLPTKEEKEHAQIVYCCCQLEFELEKAEHGLGMPYDAVFGF